MRKAAPAKESGLEVMQPQSSRKVRSIGRTSLAPVRPRMYRSPVVTLLATSGFRSPSIKLAHKRPSPTAGAFFVPAVSCHGGRAWEGLGPAGCQLARSANPRTAATNDRFAAVRGSSKPQVGATPMHHTPARSPSALQDRAAAHRAMAVAALRANSSLSVRLKRYNHHINVARSLDAQGGVQ